jgi:hypothetical protein
MIEKRNYVDVDELRVEETKRLERVLAAKMLKRLVKVPEKKKRASGRGKGRGEGKRQQRGRGCSRGIGGRGGASALSESETEDEDVDADGMLWSEGQWGQDGGEHGDDIGHAADGGGADGADVAETRVEDGGTPPSPPPAPSET